MASIPPRKPGSNRTGVNRVHIAAREVEGPMAPARSAGRPRRLPRGSAAARHAVSGGAKRGALEILPTADRAGTRTRKVAEAADRAARGARAPPLTPVIAL